MKKLSLKLFNDSIFTIFDITGITNTSHEKCKVEEIIKMLLADGWFLKNQKAATGNMLTPQKREKLP